MAFEFARDCILFTIFQFSQPRLEPPNPVQLRHSVSLPCFILQYMHWCSLIYLGISSSFSTMLTDFDGHRLVHPISRVNQRTSSWGENQFKTVERRNHSHASVCIQLERLDCSGPWKCNKYVNNVSETSCPILLQQRKKTNWTFRFYISPNPPKENPYTSRQLWNLFSVKG